MENGLLPELLRIAFAVANERGGASHPNGIGAFIPLNLEVSAAQMDEHPPACPAVQNAGDCHSARARAAGPGFPAAALPHTHFDLVVIDDVDKLRVDPLREERVTLKFRAEVLQWEFAHVEKILKHHTVRVSHRNAGDMCMDGLCGAFILYFNPLVDNFVPRQPDRDFGGRKDRPAHIDAHGFDGAAFDVEIECF